LSDQEVDQATIDEQFGAGGIGRIGGEVEVCGGDFGCGAGSAERNAGLGPLDEVVLLSRCEAAFVEDRGDDRTGGASLEDICEPLRLARSTQTYSNRSQFGIAVLGFRSLNPAATMLPGRPKAVLRRSWREARNQAVLQQGRNAPVPFSSR